MERRTRGTGVYIIFAMSSLPARLKYKKHICMAGVQSMCNVKENIQLIVYYVEE